MVRFEDTFRMEWFALLNPDNDVFAPGLDPRVQGSGLPSAILALSYYLLRPRFRMAHASM
jgi:hypothetical protein